MKYLCGRCIHIDVCLVPRSTGCVEECKYFKEMPSHLPKQTNEEYLRSLNTEQLAEWILDVSDECFDCGKSDNGDCPFGKSQGVCTCINKDSVVRWLKQPHTAK